MTKKHEPRLEISPRMRQFLDYDKFERPDLHILILGTKYFFDESWNRAAMSLGWQTRTIRSAMVGHLTRDDMQEFFTAIAEFRPDFVLTSNYAGMDSLGLFTRFLEDARIAYVSWFTDTPRMILYHRQIQPSPYNVAAVWERAYISHLHGLGFKHVYHMPLATDPALFERRTATEWTRPVAFVGSSMVDFANDAWRSLERVPEVVHAMLAAFEMGQVTRENFAAGIDRIIDPALLRDCAPDDLRRIELCFIYEATRRNRAELALMTERFGLEVRGDEHWQMITASAGGPVGYYDDLADYYRTTAINLNSTSLQMRSAVNQRVFDCPAAGGFLITDAQPDLHELFEPEEIVTYSNLDELQDKIRYYLPRPQERLALTSRAQRRVLAHHTHAHRLENLAKYLRSIFT